MKTKELPAYTLNEYMKLTGMATKTQTNYLIQINLFIEDNQTDLIGVAQMNQKDLLRRCKDFCIDHTYSRRFALIHLFRYLEDREMIQLIKDEISGERPTRKNKRRGLDMGTFRKLVKYLTGEYKLITLIMFEACIRIQATLDLTIDNIESETEEKKLLIIVTEDKGGEEIVSYLSEDTSKLLNEHIAKIKTNKLFSMSYQTFRKEFAVLSKKAIKKEITAHQIKHTRGMQEFGDGTDLIKIAEILKHKSVNTTTFYRDISGIGSKKFMEERKEKFRWIDENK